MAVLETGIRHRRSSYRERALRYVVAACSQRSLGRSALGRKAYAKAAGHFTLALARNPLHSEVWFSLGFCHLKQDDFAAATAAFTRTVQLDAENGEAWNNLGVLHLRAGRHAPAFTALGVALKVKAANWQARAGFPPPFP